MGKTCLLCFLWMIMLMSVRLAAQEGIPFICDSLSCEQKDPTCDNPFRYRCDIFNKKITVKEDIPYAKFFVNQYWYNPLLDHCFAGNRSIDSLNLIEREIKMDLYYPKNSRDSCDERSLIIFVHGGGFNAFSRDNKNSSINRQYGRFFSSLGYMVAVIDYRKGWDMGVADVMEEYPYFQNCVASFPLTQNASQFSLITATYRIVQDIRAAHRTLLFMRDTSDNRSIRFDPDDVYYFGVSTGAMGVLAAAYAVDDLPEFPDPQGRKLKNLSGVGLPDAFGKYIFYRDSIKVKGIGVVSGAIHKIDWIEPGEPVPTVLFHGELDDLVPYEQGPLIGISSYNGSSDLTYLDHYGSREIYNRLNLLNNGMPESPVHLFSYICAGHEIGVTQCPDMAGNSIYPGSGAALFFRDMTNGEIPDDGTTSMVNSFSNTSCFSVESNHPITSMNCVADTMYLGGDTLIIEEQTVWVPGDTTYLFPDTTIFCGDTTIVFADTVYSDSFQVFIEGDTLIAPVIPFPFFYTPIDTAVLSSVTDEIDFGSLSIFPNPSGAGVMQFRIEGRDIMNTFELLDVRGRLLAREEVRWFPGDVIIYSTAALQSGIYMIQLKGSAGNILSGKFVVP